MQVWQLNNVQHVIKTLLAPRHCNSLVEELLRVLCAMLFFLHPSDSPSRDWALFNAFGKVIKMTQDEKWFWASCQIACSEIASENATWFPWHTPLIIWVSATCCGSNTIKLCFIIQVGGYSQFKLFLVFLTLPNLGEWKGERRLK